MSKKWICQKRIFKDTWIRSLKSESNMQITDGTIPGLYLRYSRLSHGISFYLACQIKTTGKRANIFLGKLYEFDSVEDVKLKAKEIRSSVRGGGNPLTCVQEQLKQSLIAESKKQKYNDLFEEYMEKHAKLHKKKSTQDSNKAQHRLYIQPIFGDMYIEDIEHRHIVDAYAKWATDTSFSTANKVVSLVSDFWKWCIECNYAHPNSNPCIGLRKGKNQKYIPRILDTQGYKAFFDALEKGPSESKFHPRFFRALKAIALTGCRYQEITQLEVDEIDLSGKRLRLKKGKRGAREVKLADFAVPEIERALQEAQLLGSPYAFPGVVDTSKGLADIRKAFYWTLQKAKLPHMRIHDLRHSFITMGANMGESMLALRDAAGHSRVTTTEGYSHLADAATYKAVNNIVNQMLSG